MDQSTVLVDAAIIENAASDPSPTKTACPNFGSTISSHFSPTAATAHSNLVQNAPLTSPKQNRPHGPRRIIRLRKTLAEDGLDNGPKPSPDTSPATIWRTRLAAGSSTPNQRNDATPPISFDANPPDECCQADTTHRTLADGAEIEILDIIDHHSSDLIAARAFRQHKTSHVTAVFLDAFTTCGAPASVLTDNGVILTAQQRRGHNERENVLHEQRMIHKQFRPSRPQTCGQIERFHQTLKRPLANNPPPEAIAELKGKFDAVIDNYNHHRPRRSPDNMTPHQAFAPRAKAQPGTAQPPTNSGSQTDRVDSFGRLALHHGTTL